MAMWIFRAELVIAGAGIFLMSPLADLLPVDLWLWVKELFQPEGMHLFMRVMPGAGSSVVEYSLIAVGIAMVLVGHFLRKSA